MENESDKLRSTEAEQGLIGTLLLDPMAIDNLPASFSIRHCGYALHRRILSQIVKIRDNNRTPTPRLVAHALSDNAELTELGGVEYLMRCIEATPRLDASSDAEIISDLFRRRVIVDGAKKLLEQSHDFSIDDPGAEIDSLFEAIDIGGQVRTGGIIGEVLLRWGDRFKDAYQAGESRVGATTGFKNLDDTIHGFRPGELVVLAGRPGMGKTAIALYMALSSARAGNGVGFVSIEMSEDPIMERIVSMEIARENKHSRIPYEHFVYPDKMFEEEARAVFETVAGEIGDLPFHLARDTARTPSSIAREMRRAQRVLASKGSSLDVIFIDYVQIIRPDSENRNRVHEIDAIVKAVHNIGKTLGCCVVALAQLNRSVEMRDDKRPKDSDLRDSGTIEQDADKIIFPFREEVYIRRQEPDSVREQEEWYDWNQRLERARNKVELIVAKNRGGQVKTVLARCDMPNNWYWEDDPL